MVDSVDEEDGEGYKCGDGNDDDDDFVDLEEELTIACCGQICYSSVFLMMFLNCGQISCFGPFGLETLDLYMY